ncbi:MAG: protein-L-isoaspartate O-methyltransferase [Hyphomicrobiales bacterium]|nr:protein-L-isoaspartate O-methyltransferase [Hyphomicrobiales bacterium]
MTDFAQARRMMVEGQIRTNDVTELNVLGAFSEVPRERFVPERWQPIAYLDRDVPVGESAARCLLKPMVLAKLIQSAAIGEGDRVLDVGCATGYSTAILAKLSRLVVALEEDDHLAASAARTLAALGAANPTVVTGKLADGWPREAPYDVILLNGSTEVAPQTLLNQLSPAGGRLVTILGRAPIGRGTVYRRSGSHVSAHPEFDAVAPLLPGFSKPPAFVF